MKILFDTNIIIDVLFERPLFVESSARLIKQVEAEKIIGCLCATTITTLFYIGSKRLGAERAMTEIRYLLHLYEIASVNRSVLEAAVNADFRDFEDSVLTEAAIHVGADAIVMRNERDFVNATIPVYTPDELLSLLNSS